MAKFSPSSFLTSLLKRNSSFLTFSLSTFSATTSSFLPLISLLANGPPRLDPAISPKVAAAIATLFAPVWPSSSTMGAIAAAVPCPPVMAVEPVNRAINGSTPVKYPTPTATTF